MYNLIRSPHIRFINTNNTDVPLSSRIGHKFQFPDYFFCANHSSQSQWPKFYFPRETYRQIPVPVLPLPFRHSCPVWNICAQRDALQSEYYTGTCKTWSLLGIVHDGIMLKSWNKLNARRKKTWQKRNMIILTLRWVHSCTFLQVCLITVLTNNVSVRPDINWIPIPSHTWIPVCKSLVMLACEHKVPNAVIMKSV